MGARISIKDRLLEGIESLFDGYSKMHEAFNLLKTQNALIQEF